MTTLIFTWNESPGLCPIGQQVGCHQLPRNWSWAWENCNRSLSLDRDSLQEDIQNVMSIHFIQKISIALIRVMGSGMSMITTLEWRTGRPSICDVSPNMPCSTRLPCISIGNKRSLFVIFALRSSEPCGTWQKTLAVNSHYMRVHVDSIALMWILLVVVKSWDLFWRYRFWVQDLWDRKSVV